MTILHVPIVGLMKKPLQAVMDSCMTLGGLNATVKRVRNLTRYILSLSQLGLRLNKTFILQGVRTLLPWHLLIKKWKCKLGIHEWRDGKDGKYCWQCYKGTEFE